MSEMLNITKMATKRSSHSVGFFSDLNKLSCADFYVQNSRKKTKKTIDEGRQFSVERVLTSRRSKDADIRDLNILIFYYKLSMDSSNL
jgi:hypothetical protein